MSIYRVLLPVIVLIFGFAYSPGYSSDIISCDSFEMCADGNPPLTNYLLELESKVEGLEGNVAELEAEIVARQVDLTNAKLSNSNLSSAKLPFVNFTGANLFNVNLTGSDLTNAIWSNTICPDGSNSDTNGLDRCVPIPYNPENTEDLCSDGLDNDGDSFTDCEDFECNDAVFCGGGGFIYPENTEELCSDGVSNDGDVYIDCDDFDCNEALVCGGGGFIYPENTEERCSDGVSNDGDVYIDCDDVDCSDAVVCGGGGFIDLGPENTEGRCSDGVDNDGDVYVDCSDFDCNDAIACGGGGFIYPENTEERCSDGVSNDGDVYIDCDDFDCDDALVCGGGGFIYAENTEEFCSDGVSNDGDVYIDCDDVDCSDAVFCGGGGFIDLGPENTEDRCSDGVSNDGDVYIDCDDFDCGSTTVCTVPVLAGFGPDGFIAEGTTASTTSPSPLTVALQSAVTQDSFVTINSPDPNLTVVGNGVTIPEGSNSATVLLNGVGQTNPVTLMAILGDVTLSADVRVLGSAEVPSVISIAPPGAVVVPGESKSMWVILDFPSFQSATSVGLSLVPGTFASIPTSVEVPVGRLSASLTLDAGLSEGQEELTATIGVSGVSTTVTIIPYAPENTEEFCSDGISNDGDAYVDCDDNDCDATAVCGGG